MQWLTSINDSDFKHMLRQFCQLTSLKAIYHHLTNILCYRIEFDRPLSTENSCRARHREVERLCKRGRPKQKKPDQYY